jgi:hypothetical protein
VINAMHDHHRHAETSVPTQEQTVALRIEMSVMPLLRSLDSFKAAKTGGTMQADHHHQHQELTARFKTDRDVGANSSSSQDRILDCLKILIMADCLRLLKIRIMAD